MVSPVKNLADDTLKGGLLQGGASGVYAKGYIKIASNVADGETVTIGSDTYEFDTDATVTAGNIAVDVSADQAPAAASAALASAINTRNNLVKALNLDANTVLVMTKTPEADGAAITMAETMAGAGNEVDTSLDSEVAPSLDRVRGMAITPSARDISEGVIRVPLTFTPQGAIVQVRVAASGAAVAWDGNVTLDTTNNMLLIDNAGATDWDDTSVVNVLVF